MVQKKVGNRQPAPSELPDSFELRCFVGRLDGVESGTGATALVTQQNQIGAAANTELSQKV